MRKDRGQALVEFVIILPILLIILLGMIDFGNIILKKYHLESSIDTTIDLYKENRSRELETFLKEEEIKITYEKDNEFTKIILTKEINIITPGLNIFLDNPYQIQVERIIYEE